MSFKARDENVNLSNLDQHLELFSAGRRGFMIAALYGALDEAHQAFSPGRSSGFDDWIADIVGALIGGLIGARGRVD